MYIMGYVPPAPTATVSTDQTSSGGTLTVTDGSHTASLLLLGHYRPAEFTAASDGSAALAHSVRCGRYLD